ncbi:type II toxin-antitoxin system Phd/YefM family antitoxin [Anabaena azotica]|uniref:type II toxin-antitoxin system Phd/YefM family antitoxin n=1 Tax=Anabaena azotica TaxID=197653 RepID=UPI0039A5ADB2
MSKLVKIAIQIYTLTDARNQHGEVFDKVTTEPVLLTKQSLPSYVIISAQSYEKLIHRLKELEDMLLGQSAEVALTQSKMVSIEVFNICTGGFSSW